MVPLAVVRDRDGAVARDREKPEFGGSRILEALVAWQ